MKKVFGVYSTSLILILIGVVVFVITRGPELYGPENTNYIKGILAENIKEGVHDESEDYIGFSIKGHHGFYEFSSCSYNDRIASVVRQLKRGDEIAFYAKKKSSSITFPWKGKKYKTYRICDATLPQYGHIMTFAQYNRCYENQVNIVIPILSGILVLMGLFGFIRKLKDRENQSELSIVQATENLKDIEVIKLKPDKLSYILRNSHFSLILIGLGLFMVYPFNINDINWMGLACILGGLILPFLHNIVHHGIFYIIDHNGIYIKEKTIFFQNESEFVRYQSIRELTYRQDFFESGKNIGTIFIDNGQTDIEGNTIYTKLIGIENYKELAKLILERADLIKE